MDPEAARALAYALQARTRAASEQARAAALRGNPSAYQTLMQHWITRLWRPDHERGPETTDDRDGDGESTQRAN